MLSGGVLPLASRRCYSTISSSIIIIIVVYVKMRNAAASVLHGHWTCCFLSCTV